MKVFITGLPGVGKTHVGAKLALHLGFQFYDLDVVIEESRDQTVSEIIQNTGHEGFREAENEILKKNLSQHDESSNFVMSTGGGTVCFNDNLRLIKEAGILVYLKDELQPIANRIIKNGHDVRPLLTGVKDSEMQKNLEKLLLQRRAYYEQSHIIVRLSGVLDLHLFTKRLELFTG